jgi:hypothetical protein
MMENGLDNGWTRNGINPTLSHKGKLTSRHKLGDPPLPIIAH